MHLWECMPFFYAAQKECYSPKSYSGTLSTSFSMLASLKLPSSYMLSLVLLSCKYNGYSIIVYILPTFSFLVPSVAPTNVKAVSLSSSSIEVTWRSNATLNISGYILFYREKLLRSEAYQSIATHNLSITLQGLKAYTEYILRVLAYNDRGNGLSTRSLSVRTKEAGIWP